MIFLSILLIIGQCMGWCCCAVSIVELWHFHSVGVDLLENNILSIYLSTFCVTVGLKSSKMSHFTIWKLFPKRIWNFYNFLCKTQSNQFFNFCNYRTDLILKKKLLLMRLFEWFSTHCAKCVWFWVWNTHHLLPVIGTRGQGSLWITCITATFADLQSFKD